MVRARRVVILVIGLMLISVGLTAPAIAGPEGSFVAKINAERTARGLGPLDVYWDLTDDARVHSRLMMQEQVLHHNPDLGSVANGWMSLGENVGVGPSVDSLHQAFMDSAGHRANVLGDFNYVGVGVVEESDDKMWVTAVFMKGREGLTDPPETTTTTTTTAAPPPPLPIEPEPTPAPAPAPVAAAAGVVEPPAPPHHAPETPPPEAPWVPRVRSYFRFIL